MAYRGIDNLRRLLSYVSVLPRRRYGSALYLSGRRATETCAVVMPHVDPELHLKNIDRAEIDSAKRKQIRDFRKLKRELEFYLAAVGDKKKLEAERDAAQSAYAESDPERSGDEIDKLKHRLKIMREDLKRSKAALNPIEEEIMLDLLALPNVLHPDTPESENVVIFSYKDAEITERSPPSSRSDLILLKNPYQYYLMNDAALFELSSKYFFSERLRDCGYIQFSNADFVKSAVVEGCGSDHTDPERVFILHHNESSKADEHGRLHLTGGGSLFSFAAYHTRNLIQSSAFPLKYFSLGRRYAPVAGDSDSGLAEVAQSSVAEIFIAVRDCEIEMNMALQKAIVDISDIYKKIDYPFRVCKVSADKLSRMESLRIGFEMYSPSTEKYIEVGNLSVSDGYVSRRLQFVYKDDKDERHPRIISGTVLNVPKLLSCVLERNSEFKIPTVLQNSL